MNNYRTWQVKRGEVVKGPFPEPLVCHYILLGRIRADDQLSADGHFWKSYQSIPEIMAGIDRILGAGESDNANPGWREERRRAMLRHLDERKQPDRRQDQGAEASAQWQTQRTGEERRKVPETREQHIYRRTTREVDQSLRAGNSRLGWAAVSMVGILGLLGWGLHHFQAKDPIKVGLRFSTVANCNAAPAKGVNWHGCDKSGYLLVGADLRAADLGGANLAGANLSYARLEGANLKNANLADAIWTDGRKCAEGSISTCN